MAEQEMSGRAQEGAGGNSGTDPPAKAAEAEHPAADAPHALAGSIADTVWDSKQAEPHGHRKSGGGDGSEAGSLSAGTLLFLYGV